MEAVLFYALLFLPFVSFVSGLVLVVNNGSSSAVRKWIGVGLMVLAVASGVGFFALLASVRC